MPMAADYFEEGNVHRRERRYAFAIDSYDRAIASDPAHAKAFMQRGRALLALGRKAEAMASCTRATTLSPELVSAWLALGEVLGSLSQDGLALKAFRTAQRLAPDRSDLLGRVLQQKMLCCDWDGMDDLVADIEARLAKGDHAIQPFYWQAISSSPQSLLAAAENYQRAVPPLPGITADFPAADCAPDRRIRIGYVSGELNISANGLVMAGVFDHHDRDAFEVFAFDNSEDQDTSLRTRIMQSFDHVIDVRGMTDARMADAMRAQKIDIAIDLNGFFGNTRSAVFRHRPAPVQVSYLGCPGTSGAPHFDYLIADNHVVPGNERQFYSEKIVYMPDSYYPTDHRREIADREFTRAECGLPETGFVFCCFNTCHKIAPETFSSWMRILGLVEGSVLWLFDANPTASANLRNAAAANGVDPARLIFAPRMRPALHLARHRCADLFLDTLPYNAHTTATDALWAGLPVLTCKGTTFPGRVAASLLQALRLPELIADTRGEYERRAVELARQPEMLAALRERLRTTQLTTPLFDTARFTHHLETAYRMMHQRRIEGLAPAHLMVADTEQKGITPT